MLTMVDNRTNYAKEISGIIRETYGHRLRIFNTEILRSVRAEKMSAEGKSIFAHDPKGKVAAAYSSFESFSKAIAEYIGYYDNSGIQAKTKWIPPSKFRKASMMET